MGMIIKLNLIFRILLTIVFVIAMGLSALLNPGAQQADAWATAAVMGLVVLLSNWLELVETAAHMAHHVPGKGVHSHEGNHESSTHPGR